MILQEDSFEYLNWKNYKASFSNHRGMIMLAYHAAFPVVLTSDLLYKIWLNFNHDEEGKPLHIPLEGVGLFLNSNICHIIGNDLYQISKGLQEKLWKELFREPGMGIERVIHLAQFLKEYIDHCHYKLPSEAFAEAQRFKVDFTLRRDEVHRDIFNEVSNNIEREDAPGKVKSYLQHIEKYDYFYEEEGSSSGIADINKHWLEGWDGFFDGDDVKAKEGFDKLKPYLKKGTESKLGGLSIPLPKRSLELIGLSASEVEKGQTKTKVFALLVGINEYPKNPIFSGTLDAKRMRDYLLSRTDIELYDVLLSDQQATKGNIVNAFGNHLSKADENDTVLFYFSGLGGLELAGYLASEPDEYLEVLRCYSETGVPSLLADIELHYLIGEIVYGIKNNNSNPPHIVTIFETHFRIEPGGKRFATREWNDFVFADAISLEKVEKNSMRDILPQVPYVQMTASRRHQPALEVGNSGLFTKHLLQVLNSSKGRIDYLTLHSLISNYIRFKYKQKPQLIAKGASSNLLKKGFLNLPIQNENDSNMLGKGELSGIVSYNSNKGWLLNLGEIHGVASGDMLQIESGGKIIEASIDKAHTNVSEVNIDFEIRIGLDKDCFYEADVFISDFYPVRVYINNAIIEDVALDALKNRISQTNIFVSFVSEENLSDYSLHFNHRMFFITKLGDNLRPVFAPILLEDSGWEEQLFIYLRQLVRWEFGLKMYNWRDGLLNTPPIGIEIKEAGRAVDTKTEGNVEVYSIDNANLELTNNKYRAYLNIKLTNNYTKRLYFSMRRLWQNRYSSATAETEETPGLLEQEIMELLPGESYVVFSHHNKHIEFTVEEGTIRYNKNYDSSWFQLLVSTEPNIYFSELTVPRSKAKQGNVGWTLEGGDRFPPKRVISWTTQLFEIRLKNPIYNQIKESTLNEYLADPLMAPFAKELYKSKLLDKDLSLGDSHLLVIGINKYQDSKLPQLNNTVLGAQEIKRLLVDKYQFENDKLIELYDEEATQSKIINALRWYAESLGEKDSLLIYYAGHGEYDEAIDVGYWIPNDAEYGNIGSYLSFDMLSRWLKAIKSRHTFIMTDSTHSGSFFATNRSTRNYKDRLESMASRWLLTAGRNKPVLDGDPGEHSPFAKAVLYHLIENDKPRMAVSDFCNRIMISVGNNSDALPRFGAIRNVGDMGGEFMFRLKPYADKLFEEDGSKTGQIRGEPQELSMNRGFDLPKKNPKLPLGDNHLLVVGVNKYQDSKLPQLNNAVLEAKEVKRLLLEKYQFDSDKLIELYDEEATQSQIINALRKYVKLLGEKDTLLIYFVGHGEYDEAIDVGYWIPNDAEYANIGSYLSFDMLSRWLKAIKSRHTFIIADSCYSGSFFVNNRSTRSYEDRLESMASRWLLTAGRNEPVPDGDPGEHSPFAKAVLYHLKENDKPRMAVSDFCNRIKVAVGNNLEALPFFGAIRNVGDMGGEFMFRLKPYADAIFEEESSTSTQIREDIQRSISTTSVEPPPQEGIMAESMRTIEDVRNRIEQLIGADDFETVFELMKKILNDHSLRYDEIIIQENNYNSIKSLIRSNMVDLDTAEIILNKIRGAVNDINEELKEKDFKADIIELPVPEKAGLIEQAEILQKKLDYLKKELLTAYDTNQKFALQEQIDETKKKLDDINKSLSD